MSFVTINLFVLNVNNGASPPRNQEKKRKQKPRKKKKVKKVKKHTFRRLFSVIKHLVMYAEQKNS